MQNVVTGEDRFKKECGGGERKRWYMAQREKRHEKGKKRGEIKKGIKRNRLAEHN